MTPCDTRIDALRAADIAELDGSRRSELERHIASCAGCREAAARILEGNRVLDQALTLTTSPDIDALLARASTEPVQRDERSPTRRIHRWSVVAAAAAIGAVMLGRGFDRPLPGDSPPILSDARVAIDVPGGRDVAVLQTDNPDITVLWFFQED